MLRITPSLSSFEPFISLCISGPVQSHPSNSQASSYLVTVLLVYVTQDVTLHLANNVTNYHS